MMPLRWKHSLSPISLLSASVGLAVFCAPTQAAKVLWQVGAKDGSAAEFTSDSLPSFPKNFNIPKDWSTRKTWPEFAGHSPGDPNRPDRQDRFTSDIAFELATVPPNGALFTFKTTNASSFVAELAVFANRNPCGILQMVGTEGWTNTSAGSRRFGQSYQLYIPKEFLRQGSNLLRLQKLGQFYNRSNAGYLSFTWDYMKLESLDWPASEPIHSRHIYMTMVWGGFDINDRVIANEPSLWKWMGVAYSGNTVRLPFWVNTSHLAPKSTEYVEMLREHNMSAILNRTNNLNGRSTSSEWLNQTTGELSDKQKAIVDDAMRRWGDNIQYYEINNEPCMVITNGSFEVTRQTGIYLNKVKPAHLKVVEPGYAYGGGTGEPVNWDQDDAKRKEIAKVSQATGGHSYGTSYASVPNGSLMETIDTYGPVIDDGFPREFVVTETGSHYSSHKDFTNMWISQPQLQASTFSRILRAHIGFADRIMIFSAWTEDTPFRLLDGDRYNPMSWKARSFSDTASERRMKLSRLLSWSYATHGAPLSYSYLDTSVSNHNLVYVRAVNTATLEPLPGSGAKSNKILLTFSNFEKESKTLKVRVVFPKSGVYSGDRYGPGDSYAESWKPIASLRAEPHADFTETVGPREVVGYVLELKTSASNKQRLHRGLESGMLGKPLQHDGGLGLGTSGDIPAGWRYGDTRQRWRDLQGRRLGIAPVGATAGQADIPAAD